MTDVETPHELVLVNRYDARPEQVWAAWTKPENFVQWWCPPDWTVSDVVMEVQPHGRFRQTGVVTDEHFEALKAGTKMFFARLGEFLSH